MENWGVYLLLAGILLIFVASFAFPMSQPSALGQQMSDNEAFQVFVGILGLAAVIGGIYKK